MNQITGAELTIRLLKRQNINIIAGIPGGSNLPLYDALAQHPEIRHILARHEQGAGFIAQGISRTTGRPSVCLATSGPGATNLFTALADAKLDSIPIICITGQVPRHLIGTDAFQEVDTYGMSMAITKHNFIAGSAHELPDIIPEAFRIAVSGRPGPVLIDIPRDVQTQVIGFERFPEPGIADPSSDIDQAALDTAIRMINASRRPILYTGGGIMHSCASGIARELAEKAGIPVAMTLMGLGAIPSDHPLSLGMLGMHGARYTNMALEECDLLIAAGTRFDDRATGRIAEFCPDAGIIHIDIDPAELNKLRQIHVGIKADLKEALELILPFIEKKGRNTWLDRIAQLKRQYPMIMQGKDDPLKPYGIIRRIGELAGEDAIVATDVGKHQMWVAQAYPFQRPRQFLTSGGLGTMGFGLPAAIGASLACPDRKVICFSGDGSLLMNIQEFATAVEEDVNITVILFNNNSLGMVRQQQDLFFGRRYFASEFKNRVDFSAIARGFGIRTFDLAGGDDPAGTIAEALAWRGPCLIHAPVDLDEDVYPMVPPGAANREMIGGPAFGDWEEAA